MSKKNKEKPWLNYYKESLLDIKYSEKSMFDVLEENAQSYLRYPAYIYFNKKTSYSDFLENVHLAAKALKSLGVSENDKVTICMPTTPQALILFYATNLIGAIANMIHPLSSEKEIEYYLKLSESTIMLTLDFVYNKVVKNINNTFLKKIIISSPADELPPLKAILYWTIKGRNTRLGDLPNNVIYWQEFLDYGRFYQDKYIVKRKGSDPAAILYSGGTTGNPKGILLSNNSFNAFASVSKCVEENLYYGDTSLCILPLFHAFGLGASVHAMITRGVGCILIPDFKAKNFHQIIKKNKPNVIMGVPTLFEALINNDNIGPNDLECIKVAVSGGDFLSDSQYQEMTSFLKEHGCHTSIRVGYGMTECCGPCCLALDGEYAPYCVGIPLPSADIKIVKIGTCEEASPLEDGEICIGGKGIMLKYIKNDEETKQVLKKHSDGKIWLHSGDIGNISADGHVYFKQRLKRMIISSGYNVYPSYIENVLNAHSAVKASAVIGIPHPYKVQVAKAYIVLKDNVKLTDELKSDIEHHCKINISKYSLPAEYVFKKELPRTKINKIDYKKLEEENNYNGQE